VQSERNSPRNATLDVACDAAIEAAKKTGRGYSLIVTDWNSAQWSGLAKV
jgi:hypothetical protein